MVTSAACVAELASLVSVQPTSPSTDRTSTDRDTEGSPSSRGRTLLGRQRDHRGGVRVRGIGRGNQPQAPGRGTPHGGRCDGHPLHVSMRASPPPTHGGLVCVGAVWRGRAWENLGLLIESISGILWTGLLLSRPFQVHFE